MRLTKKKNLKSNKTQFLSFGYNDISCVYAPYTKEKFLFFNTIDNKEIKNFIKKQKKIIPKYKEENEISTIYIFLTTKCNFSCKYCFEKNEIRNLNQELNPENIDNIINLIKKFKLSKKFRFFLYGGEPILNKETLINLVNKIKRDDRLKSGGITICTNGSIYSKTLTNFFKKNEIYLSISLDGNQTLNKERIFNNNLETFNLVKKNIKKYKSNGLKITISCTINNLNIDYLPQLLIFFKKLNIESVGFNMPIKDGSINIDYLSYQLFKTYEISHATHTYEDLTNRRIKSILLNGEFLRECNASGKQIVIYPDMTLSPCMVAKKNINNYFEMKKELNKWIRAIPIKNNHCSTCILKNICGGGCLINRINNINVPEKNYCRFVKNTIKYWLKRQINREISTALIDIGSLIKLNNYQDFKKILKYLEQKYKKIIFFNTSDKEKIPNDFKKIIFKENNEIINKLHKNTILNIKQILKKEQIKPYKCILISDSYKEISIAENFGMKTALIKSGLMPQSEWIKKIA